MPRAVQYKADSVIYFAGDTGDKIFILQQGKVVLRTRDIETGEEVSDLIQTGEFFGVKSALGRYPREDDAMVISDSLVVVFTVPEFEQVVSNNTRVIMKMLKVFSNQLRRIHGKVRNLIGEGEAVNPEDGLYNIIEYYLGRKSYKEALYTINRYIQYYPQGRFIDSVRKYQAQAEQYAQKYGQGRGPAFTSGMSGHENHPEPASPRAPKGGVAVSSTSADLPEESPDDQSYYQVLNLVGTGSYSEALGLLKPMIDKGESGEYYVPALFQIGRCFFGQELYDKAIKHLTGTIQKYPKMDDFAEALLLIGQSYEKSGNTAKASAVFQKIVQSNELDEVTRRKARKALNEIR
ncbi:cyclic nucleotide-binding domain-containing protein [Spirochaeta lutea]|uniref:Cyclic nucleotide-binding domain-containing protein n=1 Tax=Spirochaeta lutea TaxID=1480694 RepID=A0A098R4G8_9SPIO|nr:cyclic nucleotide-binding domain-containing protein [Spirochaeta lutea]KGE73657.1 hypothetical protein DC28_03225 [Spirochaeta lutea]